MSLGLRPRPGAGASSVCWLRLSSAPEYNRWCASLSFLGDSELASGRVCGSAYPEHQARAWQVVNTLQMFAELANT